MPKRTTVKSKKLSQDSQGRFLRNIGWINNPKTEKVAQKKFYLGRKKDEALLAVAKLEALWKCVEQRFARQDFYQNIADAAEPPEVQYEMRGKILRIKELPPDRPLWCPLSLAVAEAIRKGRTVAELSLELVPSKARRVERYRRDWLYQARKDFNVIHIDFADEALSEATANAIHRQGIELKGEEQAIACKADFWANTSWSY